MKITDQKVRRREIIAQIDRFELDDLVSAAVAAKAMVDLKGAEIKVHFSDVTEGSPPYRIGIKASVTLTYHEDEKAKP